MTVDEDDWEAVAAENAREDAWVRAQCLQLCGDELHGRREVKFTDEGVEYVGRISSTPIGPPVGVEGEWWVTVKVAATEPHLHGYQPGQLQHWTVRVDLLTPR